MPPRDGCIVPDRTGLVPPPEEAKQHTNPSCHQEGLEGPLVDLAFYGPIQILKALVPLLVDLGPRRLHGLLSLSPHVLRSLLRSLALEDVVSTTRLQTQCHLRAYAAHQDASTYVVVHILPQSVWRGARAWVTLRNQ